MPVNIWQSATKTIHDRFLGIAFPCSSGWIPTHIALANCTWTSFKKNWTQLIVTAYKCNAILLLNSPLQHVCERMFTFRSSQFAETLFLRNLRRIHTHAITCLRSRLTQLASFKGGAGVVSWGSSHNAPFGRERCVTTTARWGRPDSKLKWLKNISKQINK